MRPVDVPQGRVVVKHVALNPSRISLAITFDVGVSNVVGVQRKKTIQVTVIEGSVCLVANEAILKLSIPFQSFYIGLGNLRFH